MLTYKNFQRGLYFVVSVVLCSMCYVALHTNSYSDYVMGRLKQMFICPSQNDTTHQILHNRTENKWEIPRPFKAIWLDTQGDYRTRITSLNKYLHNRHNITGQFQPFNLNKAVKVIVSNQGQFVQETAKVFPTIILPWKSMSRNFSNWSSIIDQENMLIKKYYEWSISKLYCKLMETPFSLRFNYHVLFVHHKCNSNSTLTHHPMSLRYTL